MKIILGYLNRTWGTVQTNGNDFIYSGKNIGAMRATIEDVKQMSGGKQGDDLLRYACNRLTGRVWASREI